MTDSVYTALIAAVSTLAGVAFGNVLQAWLKLKQDQRQFEYGLVKDALNTPNRAEVEKTLKFLAKAGLIKELNYRKIEQMSAEELPERLGPAVRDHLITLSTAKQVLRKMDLYAGPIDDDFTQAYGDALMKFQKTVGIQMDGKIGPVTLGKMVEAAPEYFKSWMPRA